MYNLGGSKPDSITNVCIAINYIKKDSDNNTCWAFQELTAAGV